MGRLRLPGMVEIRLPKKVRDALSDQTDAETRCPALTVHVPEGADNRCQRSLDHVERHDGLPHLIPWRRADGVEIGRTWTDEDPTPVDIEADPWLHFNDPRAPRGAWAVAKPSPAWEEVKPRNPWPRPPRGPVRPRRMAPRDPFMPPRFKG